jgi:hypothetical protein
MKFSFKLKSILVAATISVALFSCSKLDNDYQPIQVSGLNIIQASPTTELLDVYINNNRGNADDFVFGSKIGYLSAYSGIREFNVTKRNSLTSLKSLQHELKPQVGYSLFVANTLANIELFIIEDNLTKPATGKAKIRFVHASPDADALTVFLNDTKVAITEGKVFKQYSEFTEVDAAQSAKIELMNANNTVESTITNVKLEEGKIYTIFAKGLKANTDDTKFAAAIFTHTNY